MNNKEFNKTIQSTVFERAIEGYVADLEMDKIQACAKCMLEYEGGEKDPVHPVYAYFHGEKKAYERVVEDIREILKGLEVLKTEVDSVKDNASKGEETEELENIENATFAMAYRWLRSGKTVTNAKWDDCIAKLNKDGDLVDGCDELYENLTTEEIFNDEWILMNE